MRTISLMTIAVLLLAACSDDDSEGNNNNNINNNNNQTLCGNGVIDSGEDCDTNEFGTADCQSEVGHLQGSLSCNASCEIDTSDCRTCGNTQVEGPEVCDDGTNDGAYGGCATDCLSLAPHCGDGIMNGPEACDASDFGSVTCDSTGLPGGGSLTCTSGCDIDFSTCCQDGDSDGYGLHCDLGLDCDDAAPGITGACQANGCPQGFVVVDSGDFEMGCDTGDDCWHNRPEESPVHTVTLDASYCLEVTEVSVGDFRACTVATTCDASPDETSAHPWNNWSDTAGNREDHPMNGLSWYEAREYCQLWMNGDLPTEAQWERAARGTDERVYPWGNDDPNLCDECNWDLSGPGQNFGCNQVETDEGPVTWEVGHITGTAGDSPVGAKDMAGNVMEWVRDCYLATVYNSCTSGCTNPYNECSDDSSRVARGGDYSGREWEVSVVRRYGQAALNRDYHIGFRCIWTP